MTPQGLHHLAIKAADPERLAAFYRDVLGLPEVARHARDDGALRSVWLGLPAGALLMIERAGRAAGEARAFADDPPGLHLVALRIRPEDKDGFRARLAAAGQPVVHETEWTIYALDPEGNRVGLSTFELTVPGSSG